MNNLPKNEENKIEKLPVLALRGLVIFPGMMLQFDVGRKKSVAALTKAMEENQRILLVAQKDLSALVEMMRVFMIMLCSLLAVCSVSARTSRQEETDGEIENK